ncbi:MAG: HAD family hydrolase [Thermoplasmata archaeon]
MTEEIDAIMFDVGGTLVDLRPSETTLFARAVAKLGLKVEKNAVEKALRRAWRIFDDDLAKVDGKNEKEFWRRFDGFVLKELGHEGNLDSFVDHLSSEFDRIVYDVDNWFEYPDARPLLEELRKRDFKLGVVSNATDLADRVLENLDLKKYFDVIILSEKVGVRKPSAEIFHMAVKQAKTLPSRSLYVGDKLAVDVKGAKAAGMQAILVDRQNVFPDAHCLRVRDLNEIRRFL